MGPIIRKANVDAATWPVDALKCRRPASSACLSWLSWNWIFLLFPLRWFEAKYSHVLMPAWIWIVFQPYFSERSGDFCFFFPSVECPFVTDVESAWCCADRRHDSNGHVGLRWSVFSLLPGSLRGHKYTKTSTAQGGGPSDPDVEGLCLGPCCAASAHISYK